MKSEGFFEEQSEQSEIKTEIVRKYFWAWAKVISKQVKKRNNDKIGYVDLFSGQGTYEDGSKSTPIRILEGAIRDAEIREMLVTLFNDANSENCLKLQNEIDNLPQIEFLIHKPKVINSEVNDDLASLFGSRTTIPTLFFLDPWGYKGLSLKLVKSVIQSWGCDCMFFFNYNVMNRHLSNSVMDENMNSFFGRLRAEKLRMSIIGKSKEERQKLIINSLKEALTELGGKFSIEYFFKDVSGEKTSHFLIFVSKNVLGYDIMKNIMAKESSDKIQGVANFGFNPKDKQKENAPFLFDMFGSPIDDLAEELLTVFSGKTLTTNEIYQNHSVGKEFIFKNYQDALRKLEEQRKITVNPFVNKRRKITSVRDKSQANTKSFLKCKFGFFS